MIPVITIIRIIPATPSPIHSLRLAPVSQKKSCNMLCSDCAGSHFFRMVPFLNMGWLLCFGHFEFSGMMVVESHDNNKLIERSPIETCWTRFLWNWWNDGPYDGNIHERIILEILEVPVATSLYDTFSKCMIIQHLLYFFGIPWVTCSRMFAHRCADKHVGNERDPNER